MDWKMLTIANIRRLVAALEKTDPRLLESLIDRESNEVVPHGRVTIESLLNLLEQTGGSTILPPEVIALINQPLLAIPPNQKWYKQDDVIYFTVTSDGTTGEEWIWRLINSGFIPDYSCSLVRLLHKIPDDTFTNGVTTKIAVIKNELDGQTTAEILRLHSHLGLIPPHPEVACLIREKFTDHELKTMGIKNLHIMHEPIELYHSHGDIGDGGDTILNRFRIGRNNTHDRFATQEDRTGSKWVSGGHFGFALP